MQQFAAVLLLFLKCWRKKHKVKQNSPDLNSDEVCNM